MSQYDKGRLWFSMCPLITSYMGKFHSISPGGWNDEFHNSDQIISVTRIYIFRRMDSHCCGVNGHNGNSNNGDNDVDDIFDDYKDIFHIGELKNLLVWS